MIEVSNLIFYPIKACRGVEVRSWRVERMGLAADRRMMVITPEGKFLSQREFPRLALITPAIEDGRLTLSAPGIDSVRILVQRSGATLPVSIWTSTGVPAIDQGEPAAQWLSGWLGASVRLVHIADGFRRALNPLYRVTPEDHTGFADGYPILLISEESLIDLNSRMDSALPMNRFRPNLVIKGCEAFAEDNWKQVSIGDVALAVVKPCARCVVTTIDKATLRTSREPLRTLSTYRKRTGKVMFGQNVIPLGEGRLALGMPVRVLE